MDVNGRGNLVATRAIQLRQFYRTRNRHGKIILPLEGVFLG